MDGTKIVTAGGQTLKAYVAANQLQPAQFDGSAPIQAKNSKRICFFKRGTQATATLKYGMCRSRKCKQREEKVAGE